MRAATAPEVLSVNASSSRKNASPPKPPQFISFLTLVVLNTPLVLMKSASCPPKGTIIVITRCGNADNNPTYNSQDARNYSLQQFLRHDYAHYLTPYLKLVKQAPDKKSKQPGETQYSAILQQSLKKSTCSLSILDLTNELYY